MPNLPRSPAQRAATARQLIPGSAGGRSRLVAPEPRPLASASLPPTIPYLIFSQADEDVTVAESGDYELRAGGPLGVWIAKLRVAGTSTTTVQVKQNSVVIGTVNLTTGLTRAELDLSAVLGEVEDNLRINITAAGTDAKKLNVLAPIR